MESDDKKGAASGLRMFALEAQERVTDYGRSDGYASSAHIGPSSIAGNQNEPADSVKSIESKGWRNEVMSRRYTGGSNGDADPSTAQADTQNHDNGVRPSICVLEMRDNVQTSPTRPMLYFWVNVSLSWIVGTGSFH